MSPKGLCQTWGATSSVSAFGVFLGGSKPPIRVLLSLHSTCRDVRRTISDSSSLQSPITGTLITSSYKTPRSAASIPAVGNAEGKLLHAISTGQLDTAVEELKRLKSSGTSVEPYSIEQLVEGRSDLQVDHPLVHDWLAGALDQVSGLCVAALLRKQMFRAALAVFKTSQQSAPLQLHYFTYQSLVTAAIKVSLVLHLKTEWHHSGVPMMNSLLSSNFDGHMLYYRLASLTLLWTSFVKFRQRG